MKNYLGQTFWLVAILIGLLTALSFFSRETTLNGLTIRRMDIFSDIRDSSQTVASLESSGGNLTEWQPDTAWLAEAPIDSSALSPDTVKIGPLPPKDSAYYGEIIEDYTFDQSGLNAFFAAIDSIRYGRTVRVAFYGDSFVEGDIILGDLRDTLQSLWGGNGVGFVPVTSEVAKFKRTLTHDFSGFATASIIKKSESKPQYGVNGYVYFPEPGASLRYAGTGQFFQHTKSWTRLRLFYSSDSLSHEISLSINGGEAETALLPRSRNKLGVFDYKSAGISSAKFRFPETRGLRLYGASLESGPGFYLDNFSMRGNSGGPLTLLKPAFIQQFDASLHYDLVVVQYGLNAASTSLRNISWYRQELDRTYKHLRNLYPHTPILIISVPDRAGKIGGELTTLPSVGAIAAMQRDLARQHGFLFYDLYHGMGGPGTMIAFAEHRPHWANLDYTHLTHEGGKIIGYQLARLLLNEQKKWSAEHR
ncbi:MAG TPA: GDSL-type esterase/lipase family protein [Saprospiraceae bacterium]|nr:GDSL-type esterase/lipase family protein [Saprospiraceae bacterium]HNL37882.1 GDSL-type esterase/lipase family protein [Saprospiraceae bacterium]